MMTLAELLRWRARVAPDDVAIWFEGQTQTYRELDRRASQVANALIARGTRPGDRICVLDQNHDMQIELIFGIARAGAVYTPINWRLAPPEVAFVVNDAGARLLFVGGAFCALAEQIAPDLGSVRQIISFAGGPDDWERFAAIRDAAPATDPRLAIAPDATAWQMYTSGTTGHPKGAEIMHSNMLPAYLAAPSWFDMRPGDVSLVAMPLYHVSGSAWLLAGLIAGAKSIVLREFNPATVLTSIEEHRITHLVLVPAAILFVLQAAAQVRADISSLRHLIYAASPIPADLLRRAIEFFGCAFTQLYGLTETSGGVAVLAWRDHHTAGPLAHRLKSCGLPFFGDEVRVVDAAGNDCRPGEIGEIIVRSPKVMKGYWNNPAATQNAIRDGWFYSGDAGSFDEDGFLYIQDRIKDMIVSGGENIYPAEVESAVFGHPAVANAAVIGVPDARWGEAVKAIVVLKPGASASGEEIIAFCRGAIAGYKIPKSVDFVAALPRNPSGKVLKRILREPYWADQERQVR